MDACKFLFNDFNLLLGVESQLLHPDFLIIRSSPIHLHLLGLFDPVKQWLFHKDLTCVENETLTLSESTHSMHHGLLISSFQWVRSDYSFNLLSQAEWHEFWNGQLDSASKSNAKVNSKHLAISGIHKEVLQVPVANSNQIGCNGESGHALDELILDGDEGSRGQTQILKSVAQQIPSHLLGTALVAILNIVRAKVEYVEHLMYHAVLALMIHWQILEPSKEIGLSS